MSLCVEWIARAVYWSQQEGAVNALYRATLAPHARPRITWVLNTARPIHTLQISPFTRLLFFLLLCYLIVDLCGKTHCYIFIYLLNYLKHAPVNIVRS